jgi:hypothetical protein
LRNSLEPAGLLLVAISFYYIIYKALFITLKLPLLVNGDCMQKVFFIRAEWDNDASIWSATSDDIPGLATEADSIEALFNKLSSMIPEFMVFNKLTDQPEIVYEVLARKSSVAHIPSEA